MKQKILIIDDDTAVRESLQQQLSRDFFITAADCAREARLLWKKDTYAIVLLDILLPDCSGISLLGEFKKDNPNVPMIMITGTRQIKTAVEAMKLGAYDYLTKPFSVAELASAVDGALEFSARDINADNLIKKSQEDIFFGGIVGRSPGMIEVFKKIAQVMHTKTTVLIQGESGTGKELVARAIHFYGIRRAKPFMPINIASLSENLLESELFGHEKGAFTGAAQMKKGILEMADEGTVFLDEIGDIPLNVQVKLLRVLQEREFRRVGGEKDIKIDVRFIAATNKDLWQLVEKGEFREDLYYRVSVVPINIPSLRDRVSDIPLLAYHFVNEFKKSIKTVVKGFASESVDLLKDYKWPGNVRELANLIERLLLMVNQQWILSNDLPIHIREPGEMAYGSGLEDVVSVYERGIITEALTKTNGVISKAADILGTTRRVLRYKMDKLGILQRK